MYYNKCFIIRKVDFATDGNKIIGKKSIINTF